MSGEGGVGDWLGERGHDTPDMCETALLEARPLRKGNLEVMVPMRRRMEMEMENWEVEEEIVDGEYMRLGAVSWVSRF
jgi:hypothetical protein